jgi:tRNA A37 threonylcarbamoyladenosine dehydratase
MNSSYQKRFGGIARLYGKKALQQFQCSHVTIIGLGGVGTWAAESLARSGIGAFTLIDLDDICTTNINRQVHALTSTVGQSKIEAMRARMIDINPEATIDLIEDFALPENLDTLISTQTNFVIDCTDAVQTKAALIAHCKRRKIKLITVGGAGGQTDPTQIQVIDLSKTVQDPLASKVRQRLRQHYNFTKNTQRKFQVPCVFSTEQLVYPTSDGDVCHLKQASDGHQSMDCQTGFGSITHVTGTFGFAAAAYVLKKLAQKA